MKKTTVILLLLIYSLSSFGVALKEFYCCGHLKSITVTLADVEKNNGEKKNKKDGCCNTQFQSFKVKDNHVAAGHIIAPAIFCLGITANFLSFQPGILPLISEKIIEVTYPPPLHRNTPLFISNCVFRV